VTIVDTPLGRDRDESATHRRRRRAVTGDLCRDLTVHPVTLEIVQLAGKVEGEQAARGISIAFEDLLICTTALHLGYSVATLNVRHFRLIPGLSVIQL